MRIPAKLWKGVGAALVVLLAAVLAVRTWVVPALIAGQIQSRLGGRASVGSWWLGGSSAGATGLALRDGSEVWATADRVTTDLSLPGVLRGRTSPRRVTIDGAKLTVRVGRDGRVLTAVGGSSPGGGGTPPVVVVRNAEVTVRQEGRPELVVKRVQGRLAPYGGRLQLAGRSDDPEWGPAEAYGEFDPSFRSGRVTLSSKRPIAVDPRKVECIPFVPPAVWANIVPHGRVDANLTTEYGRGATGVRVELGLRRATVKSSALDITASEATGKVILDGGVVRLEGVAGQAVGGRVEAHGTLDFTGPAPRFDLGLRLTGINVADTPKSWQLDEAGITGRLSGQVRLKAVLDPAKGVDLTGTTGEAEVTGGAIEGIPVKSLKLVMRAQGGDLRYESKTKGEALRGRPGPGFKEPPLRAARGGAAPPGGAVRFPGAALPALVLALQDASEPAKQGKPALPKIQLPKTLTTQIELQDVEMAQLVSKAKLLFGMSLPIPVSGKLDLKATATIPLGALRQAKDYAFHGDLTLKGASLFRTDVGTLSARVDLADGVLELKKLRGRLVNRPNGGPDNPPESLPPVPADGPLPPGAFRMDLRAEIAPAGGLTARLEGNSLPLGELAAPALPRPTPLSGLVSVNATARADLGRANDPKAWSVRGSANSVELAYRGTILDKVALTFSVEKGRLDVSDLTAAMNGQPLGARASVGLDPPYAFDGALDVTGWDVAPVVALVPSAPRPPPVSGRVTAKANAQGTLAPVNVRTSGAGRFDRFQAGPVPLGDVPFRWTTEGDTIVVSGVDARPFGGRLRAEARVPTAPGRPVEGTASFQGVDTAGLSAAIPGEGLKLTGKAAGQVRFTIPPDVSRLESTVSLSAPDLTVQGIPAERVQASVRAHKGVLTYEVSADSLGGKVKFRGDFPLAAAPARAAAAAEGELRAAGFTLDRVWKALGVTGAATHLAGEGAVDANLRVPRAGPDAGLWVHGLAEFRGLRWGDALPLGHLRGTVALTPTSWWVEPLEGELLGGPASGQLWGTMPARGPRHLGFEFRIDRAPLDRVLGVVPALKGRCDGFGSVRLGGRLEEAFRATGELDVAQARVLGFPVYEMRVPAELVLTPGAGDGRLQVRRWTARFAGGGLQGDALLRVGAGESFQTETVLTNIDIEAIARMLTDSRRSESGRISGRVSLSGPDPSDVARYRGKVALSLSEASLVTVPVFREIDKFLGAAGGGLFEAGGVNGTIARKQLVVEPLTLAGRVVQLHATGTIGFNGQLDLDVLLNTNQIIPETGQALVRLIPGLGDAMGRRDEASLRVANYLSNRLLKLHVGGTVSNPAVNANPSAVVADTAVAFFSGVLKLPLGFVK
jgi:translocation and assembly module TamB